MFDWLRRAFDLSAPPRPARHFPYRPAYPLILKEHGPGIPATYFTQIPIPVVTAGAAFRDGVEPHGWVPLTVQGCRS